MNMFKAFESRMAEVFDSQGVSAPFSSKRLARRAAREMEAETYVVDDVDTAPALFTILVSADDDAVMRPLYATLANEISSFVEAEAARKNYVFVGKPLTRFMVEGSLRHGRFAVFANNVDANTLELLRKEEEGFLSGVEAFGGAAGQIVTPLDYVANDEPEQIFPEPEDELTVAEHELGDSSAGLTVLPADFVDEHLSMAAPTPSELDFELAPTLRPEDAVPEVAPLPKLDPAAQLAPEAEPTPTPAPQPETPEPPVASGLNPVVASRRSLADALPEVVDMQANPIVTQMPEVVGKAVPSVPEVEAAPAQIAVPDAPHHMVPNVQDSTVGATPVPVVETQPITCLLIDRQSGRTYIGTAPKTYVGRERTPGGIVLHDPNVSRRHCELTYDGTSWRIHDLDSTNGTLVNDVDVDTCVLRDGDLITLGLLNLEFRES